MFLDYFASHNHKVVPSSPVIPYDDPTILFTNAGMNQFKDVFTGKRKVDYKRATSSQKCIRAGGKHNDLDNVGFTSRHHTFFEMLGNFSFGDYFKEEAIHYAWEWVTKTLKLPKDRLFATVYTTDDEAFRLWERIAPELKNGRILRFGEKDNYWSMGDIGPNGPCSEIHFDRGEKYGTGSNDIINGDTDRFVEIWNLVFMQYETQPDGTVIDLPRPSVDTGAGLERIAAIMQRADTNYGIDLFLNLIRSISSITGANYKEHVSSHHVIADHIRALTFAIADGAGISNDGQGYVLRRILRRAARHGRLLAAHDPFIYKLVPTLVKDMGEMYPEIVEKQKHIQNVIRTEEEAFGRTLETGLELFEKIVRNTKGTVIDGEEVFRLYDTYGFPYDLTEIMAAEKGMSLDSAGFESAMERQKEQSRAGGKFEAATSSIHNALDKAGLELPATLFVREALTSSACLLHAFELDTKHDRHDVVGVILDRTPFYAESGGQVADTGRISTEVFEIVVTDTIKYQDCHVHEGYVARGTFSDIQSHARSQGQVVAAVDHDRRWAIMRNHTVTHLTHAALRKVIGEHVKQSGSYVGPDRMRFDFSHHQPLTDEEIVRIEEIVNREILQGIDVVTDVMDIAEARKSGAMALFGEKYEDRVRVVSVPGFSKELCGGTHVANISQIGPFFITLETGVASGVRRIEAITGQAAVEFMISAQRFRKDVAAIVGRPEEDSLNGVKQLREQSTSVLKELKRIKAEMFSGTRAAVGEETTVGAIRFVHHDFGNTDKDIMAGWIDSQKELNDPVFAIGIGQVNGKRTFMAAASSSAVKECHVDVGKIAKDLLPRFGGRGGGKESFAQGSIAEDADTGRLFDEAKAYLEGTAN